MSSPRKLSKQDRARIAFRRLFSDVVTDDVQIVLDELMSFTGYNRSAPSDCDLARFEGRRDVMVFILNKIKD